LFVELIEDEGLIELLRARENFANMRLAVRRVVTERPIGGDYSDEGSVAADEFEEIFEQENYGRFPLYLQEAVEAAVLGYYEAKDIRKIDYGIDRVQAQYKLKKAKELGSVFLESFFRVQSDLTNIRTMLRLKLADRDEKNLFLPGGYVGCDRFVHALDIGYEALAPLFFSTPYHDIVEGGVSYLTSENSFLVLEKLCEEYVVGFLRGALLISSGVQPVIAYFLLKEIEIRTVRMLLSGKKNGLDAKMLRDRLCQA
jgi:V/A-type H+-transporting ATPase subunit C